MIKAIGKALLTAALLPASGSAAQLTYLNCDLPAKGPDPAKHFVLTLDESKGTVVWQDKESGKIAQYKAVFTHDSVIGISDLYLKEVKYRLTISRIDLSITHDLLVDGAISSRSAGQCTLGDNTPRKF